MRERISVLLCGLSLLPLTLIAQPAARAAGTQDTAKDWTLLVYLNGDNSLDSFGPTNLEQMETVGSTSNINIVVQWASISNGKTERLLIKKSSDPSNVTSPVVQDMGTVDMGDYHSLIDFIEWGAKNYPAKHYFLDVWDHGSGWHSIQAMNRSHDGAHYFHPNDISWDNNTGNSITTQQLGQAITQASQAIGQKIDVYGSDACLMGMLEVAGEMKDSVSYFVGSQEVEPGAGWPYDKWLARWSANPNMTAKDIASALSEEYANAYGPNGSQGQSPATMAVYDLSKQDEMEQAVSTLGQSIAKLGSDDLRKVATSAENAQGFSDSDYGDLLDFMNILSQTQVRDLPESISGLQAAFGDYVVASHVTSNFGNRANGVSIWLPKSQADYNAYIAQYTTMQFDVHSGWSNALKALLPDLNADDGDGTNSILSLR